MKSGHHRFTLIALTALLFLAACQPVSTTAPTGTDRPAPVSTATKTPVKSTPTPSATPRPSLGIGAADLYDTQVEVWHALFGPAADVLEAQAVQFSASNEWGIKIITKSLRGSYAMLFDDVSAAIENGNQPALVIGLPEYLYAWDVVDFTPYLHDAEWGMSDEELADIPEIFMVQEQVDGQQLGMPAQRSARLLLYNAAWARELGFNTAPTSAEEFRNQACTANAEFRFDADLQNDGYGGWVIDTDPLTPLGWMAAFGGEATGNDGYRFDTDANRKALAFVKSLYDDNCAWLPNEQGSFTAFSERRALFATASLSDFSNVNRAMAAAGSTDEWTVIAFPGPVFSGMMLEGSSFLMLPSTDEQQLAAWLFVRWLLSPESQSRWTRNTGLFPLRASTRADLGAFEQDNPQWAAAMDLIPNGHIQPTLASWRKVRTMVGDSFMYLFRFNIPVDGIPDLLMQMDETAAELNQ